jgi:hypothetical protein
MAAPVASVIGLGVTYDHYRGVPTVRHAFAGLAAAASTLVLANALKIATPLRSRPALLAWLSSQPRSSQWLCCPAAGAAEHAAISTLLTWYIRR